VAYHVSFGPQSKRRVKTRYDQNVESTTPREPPIIQSRIDPTQRKPMSLIQVTSSPNSTRPRGRAAFRRQRKNHCGTPEPNTLGWRTSSGCRRAAVVLTLALVTYSPQSETRFGSSRALRLCRKSTVRRRAHTPAHSLSALSSRSPLCPQALPTTAGGQLLSTEPTPVENLRIGEFSPSWPTAFSVRPSEPALNATASSERADGRSCDVDAPPTSTSSRSRRPPTGTQFRRRVRLVREKRVAYSASRGLPLHMG